MELFNGERMFWHDKKAGSHSERPGCRAVCVESRPHPDFCRPKWWTDMDVIMDEARRRGMKVWILDDSHFPTGFANGAVKTAPIELHRQSVCGSCHDFAGPAGEVVLDVHSMITPAYQSASVAERMGQPVPFLCRSPAALCAGISRMETGQCGCGPQPELRAPPGVHQYAGPRQLPSAD